MDYNITVFRGNKILFLSIIIDLFSLLWTLTMKLSFNRFFSHFTEMRISTHIKSFLRFKLKLVTLVTCCSIEFFSTLLRYFCYFSILPNITAPPLAFAHLQQPPPHCNMFRWFRRVVFRWGGGCSGGGGGGCSGGGFSGGRGAKGQTFGRMKGSKGANVGGGGRSTESFCNLSLGFEMD